MVVAKSQVILRVEPEFHIALKTAALAEGMTMTDYVVRAVKAWEARGSRAATPLQNVSVVEPHGPVEVDELGPGEMAQGDLAKDLGVGTTTLSNHKEKGFRGWRFTGRLLRRKGGRAQPIWSQA